MASGALEPVEYAHLKREGDTFRVSYSHCSYALVDPEEKSVSLWVGTLRPARESKLRILHMLEQFEYLAIQPNYRFRFNIMPFNSIIIELHKETSCHA